LLSLWLFGENKHSKLKRCTYCAGFHSLARRPLPARSLSGGGFFDLPHPPNGPITVGIDGGYVRAAHKQGWFEVIAGESVVALSAGR